MCEIGFPFFLEGVLELFTTVKGMMKVYEGIVKDYDTNPCFKILSKQIAVVKVKVLSNTVNKIIRSQRVTITGQIANIGKTPILINYHDNMNMLDYLLFRRNTGIVYWN